MKKQEALNHIRNIKGYIPYVDIFSLYNNDDEIPDELINISVKGNEQYGNFMITNSKLAEILIDVKTN